MRVMGQIINNTIRVYTTNPRKIDWILKYAYNNNKDIKCVGAGVGERNNPYILFISSSDFLESLRIWDSKFVNVEENLREY